MNESPSHTFPIMLNLKKGIPKIIRQYNYYLFVSFQDDSIHEHLQQVVMAMLDIVLQSVITIDRRVSAAVSAVYCYHIFKEIT